MIKIKALKIIIIVCIITFNFSSCETKKLNSLLSISNIQSNIQKEDKVEKDSIFLWSRLNNKITETKTWLSKNKTYNQTIAIFVDMKINSGKKRLLVVDLDSNKILSRGIVAHGSGSNTEYRDSLTFSNIPESYQTSLGKYKIGSSYIGSFDKSYKLIGLEASNNKVLARSIVLHRYSCVPDDEQDSEICNSLGCIMISENYFLELDKFIVKSSRPILMFVYY